MSPEDYLLHPNTTRIYGKVIVETAMNDEQKVFLSTTYNVRMI